MLQMLVKSLVKCSFSRRALVCALLCFGASALRPAQAEIVGYWNFNDGSGGILSDVTTNANHGTLVGAQSWIAGHTGSFGDFALSFGGADTQRVQVNAAPELEIGNSSNAAFTVAFWAYDKGSYYGEVFSYGGGNLFFQTGNFNADPHQYYWSRNNATLQMTGPYLTPNVWHFVAWTYDGGTSEQGYMDDTSAPVVVKNPAGASLSAWGPLHIGCENGSAYFWNGYIDDLIILDEAVDTNGLALIKAGIYPGMPPLPVTPGTDGIWTNLLSEGDWSDVSNWASGVVASAGHANFSTLDLISNSVVHLDASYTVASLVFGDTDTNSAAAWTVDNNGSVSNILTLQGPITVTNMAAVVTISATVTSASGLVKSGPGALVITTNTYQGQTTLNDGRLTVNQLPPGGRLSFNGGRLDFSGDVSPGGVFPIEGPALVYLDVTGAGDLVVQRPHGNYVTMFKGGAGTLTLANNQQDSGALVVQDGTVVLAGLSDNALNWSTCNNASISAGATLKLGNVQAGQVYYANGFTMSNGTFDVNGQLPPVDANHAVPAIQGSGIVQNSATGSLGRAVFHINGETSFSGNIRDGDGVLALAVSSGTGTWTLSGTNTYTGPTTLNSGTLRAASSKAFSPDSLYTVGINGTVDAAGFDLVMPSLVGAGNVLLGGATLTIGNDVTNAPPFSGVISGTGSVVKVESGTQTFSGMNTYTGDTHILNGTLSLSVPSLDPNADLHMLSGAHLDLNFSATNVIRRFRLQRRIQKAGTWGAGGSGAQHETAIFSGPGILSVAEGASGNQIILIVR
ncbi:MAG: autotransporter-associated beta strand protein [Candidatus Promineifilaceae bacterium]|jgi:autotransporter-associated beta strand protein